jgi:uncharacterized membrane protein YfcA
MFLSNTHTVIFDRHGGWSMRSLAGMGGGFVMIPLMTSKHLLGLSQHAAHGTSLFAVTTTGIAGVIAYATTTTTNNNNNTENSKNDIKQLTPMANNNLDYEAAVAIATCGVITARVGALATTKLSETVLWKGLGVFMLSVAPLIPLKHYIFQSTNNTTMMKDDDNNQPPDQPKS